MVMARQNRSRLWNGFVDDLRKLLRIHGVNRFPAYLQFLECLDCRFSHAFVRLSRAADEREVFRARDPFVSVFVVEAETEQVALGVAVFVHG